MHFCKCGTKKYSEDAKTSKKYSLSGYFLLMFGVSVDPKSTVQICKICNLEIS